MSKKKLSESLMVAYTKENVIKFNVVSNEA